MAPPLTLPVSAGDVTVWTWTTGTAQTVPVPANLQDGDTVTIVAYDQVVGSSITAAGFTARYHAVASTTRGFYVFTKKVTSAATDLAAGTYSLTLSNSGRGCALASRSPIISATPIDATPTSDVINTAGASIAIPGITVGHPDADVLLCWFGNGTGGATATGSATGYTVVGQTNVNAVGSTSSIGVLQGNPGSGATGTITVALTASMASSGGFAIALLPTPAPAAIDTGESFGTPTVTVAGGTQTVSPAGIASGETFGSTTVVANQTLTLTGIATAEAFGAAHITTFVDQFLAQSTFYIAHRDGCWGTYGEETLAGYAFAAAWNPKLAFEASVWPTTDGVWVLSHDKQTGRVFSGTDLDITASTWSSLSSKTTLVGGNPIARLDDLLAAQATGTRVMLIDNKSNTLNNTALLNLLDSYGGNTRFIAKGYITATTWADAASARGYKTWGYGYQADVTGGTPTQSIGGTPNNFSTNQSHWTLLGMDQAAASAAWTYTQSFGKAIISDELATATQKANALSLGATGIMASDITQTVPSSVLAVLPSAIGSGESFGSVTVTGGPVTLTLSGIGSAEAVGSPTVTAGGTTVTLTGVASAGAVGTPTLTTGPVTVNPAGIVSSETFGGTVVTPGPVTVTAVGIASGGGLGAPTVTVGPLTLSPTGIPTGQAVGTPVVTGGAAVIPITPANVTVSYGAPRWSVSAGG